MAKKITFDKKWFNPLYFILNEIIKDENIRTVLVYGGKSSSKTISITQLLAKECLIKGHSTMAFRKESATIKNTLRESFKTSINSMYIHPAFKMMEFELRCDNGSRIELKGMDDEEKAKGIESFQYVFMDELNHYLEGEYKQINLSLRGKAGQKIFCAWNPVDENSWVKTNLVDHYQWHETKWKLPSEDSFVKISDDGKIVLIRTMYKDNYWIIGSPEKDYGFRDENLIYEYESERTKNYNSYKVNVLGEWGKTTYGGEFLKSWKSEIHTEICKYNPELAIYLSFDENVNPYFPCGVFQIENDDKTVKMIDCITLEHPYNTVSAMGKTLREKLHRWGHKGYVYITGDATSQKQSVTNEKGTHLFTMLRNELKDYKPILKLTASNPSVKDSASFLNDILAYNALGLSYQVDKDCKKAIADYENTKEDKNGNVDKKTVTNPLTKVSYQPFGHITDLTRYMFCTIFAQEYEQHRRGGTGQIKLPPAKKINQRGKFTL